MKLNVALILKCSTSFILMTIFGMMKKNKFVSIPSNIPGAQAFKFRSCNILVSLDHVGWHLSISHPHRLPTWDETKAARYALLPDNINVGILLPPKSEYVNIDKCCIHLFQIYDEEIRREKLIPGF